MGRYRHDGRADYDELADFLRASRGVAFLSAEEERRLVGAYQGGDESALGPLILSNMRFVASVARKVVNYRNVFIPLEDACQEGTMGLVHAIENFDLGRGLRLVTYAKPCIRTFILRANLQYLGIYVPDYLSYPAKGSEPEGECAEKAAVALNCRHASDAVAASGRDEMTWEALFGDGGRRGESPADYEERELVEARKDKVHEWLADLPHKEGRVIRGRFGFDEADPMNLDVLGDALGISKERIRQIEARALERLTSRFEAEGVADE